MSVEFLKQVEILGKQPYFYLIFPNKTTSVAMNPRQYQPHYKVGCERKSFATEVV
jgi:hypothetical protein